MCIIIQHHGETEEDLRVFGECLLAHAVSSVTVTNSGGRVQISAEFTPDLQDLDASQHLVVLNDLVESLRTAINHAREFNPAIACAA